MPTISFAFLFWYWLITYSDTYMVSIKEGCLMNSEAGLSVFLMNNNIWVGEAAEVLY